jgi:hypothetical protein
LRSLLQGWAGHPSHSRWLLSLTSLARVQVCGRIDAVTRWASRNAAFGPIVLLLSKMRQTWFISASNKTLATVPFPGGDDRPFVEAANSCSTRTVRRRDGWRPIQTTSGPLLLDGRRPNSTFARHGSENAQYSITPAHSSSSADAEESLMRAPERRARRAEALTGNHMALSGRLAARAEGTRQITRQILRDAGGTRQ